MGGAKWEFIFSKLLSQLKELEKIAMTRNLVGLDEVLRGRLLDITRELAEYRSAIEERSINPSFLKKAHKLSNYWAAPYEVTALSALVGEKQGFFFVAEDPLDASEDWYEVLEPKEGEEISVEVYLDSNEDAVAESVFGAVDSIVDFLGYDGPKDVEIERGSILRRSNAKAKQAMSSEALRERLAKLERAAELQGLDIHQSKVDKEAAEAIAGLTLALRDVPSACIRARSILFVKFPGALGPVVLVRPLSLLEMRAIDRFPEIQADPRAALQALATAVESIEAIASDSPPDA